MRALHVLPGSDLPLLKSSQRGSGMVFEARSGRRLGGGSLVFPLHANLHLLEPSETDRGRTLGAKGSGDPKRPTRGLDATRDLFPRPVRPLQSLALPSGGGEDENGGEGEEGVKEEEELDGDDIMEIKEDEEGEGYGNEVREDSLDTTSSSVMISPVSKF